MKKKIFLTGGTGFIGSHLVQELADKHEVFCLVPSTEIGLRNLPESVKIEFGDLVDYKKMKGIIESVQPNIIIHLGAITPVRYSFEHPEIYQDANYYATINLVHSALKLPGLEKFIFSSTMETYGWQKDR